MTDEAKSPSIEEQLAEIDREEREAAKRQKDEAAKRRIARHTLKKTCEKKYGGEEGIAFAIVECFDGFLIEISKPESLVWHAFVNSEKTQPDWERVYRTCVPAESWDRVKHEIAERPFVEEEIIRNIYALLGRKNEERAKK